MTSALKNIKVLDLSRILAGPWSTQMLADMGAEVIKIERPQKGDDTRHWGPPFINNDDTNKSSVQAAYFHSTNRNKKSLAVDISCSQGQQIIKDLVMQVDVFIENFKVGALANYGLSYQALKCLNPKLIYCSITGFGQNGPYAHKAGYDAMIQGEGGLMSITGDIDGEPMKVGVAVVDLMTGLYASNAILAALFARTHTNKGQYIDIALLDVQVAMLANQGMNYLVSGDNPQRQGNGHPNIVPYQTFATNDGRFILAVGNDQQFEKFCQVANCSELAQDERFVSNQQRVKNRGVLIPLLAKILAVKTTQSWLNLLADIGVPCGAVNTIEQALKHPQILHRAMVKQLKNKNGELVPTIASPINLSATPLRYDTAAPNLGQETKSLLQQKLAYTDKQIMELQQQKIIG
ncbi:MAG: CoA transferase [Alteromonadaceae bacterium]|nr:CoA transferase [Alteromonadaceae bacterium]